MRNVITFFVDGGCNPNPGPGGWGWVMEDGMSFKFGGREHATNNEMELEAIRQVILSHPTDNIHIKSDSSYAVGMLSNQGWRAKENTELVFEIRRLIAERKYAGSTTTFEQISSKKNEAHPLVAAGRKSLKE